MCLCAALTVLCNNAVAGVVLFFLLPNLQWDTEICSPWCVA